jgi:uncharacterized membrane protein
MRKLLLAAALLVVTGTVAHAQQRERVDDLCDRCIDEVTAARVLIAKQQAELDAANKLIAKDAEIIAAKNETIEAYKTQAATAEKLAKSEGERADANQARAEAEKARADINEGLYKSEKKKNSKLRLENVVLKVGVGVLTVLRVFF